MKVYDDYSREDLIQEIEDLQDDVMDLEDANGRLELKLTDIETEQYDNTSLRYMIKSLYVAKTAASDREFDMQLRDMFLKVLDKRL